jgi:hypothetical protein
MGAGLIYYLFVINRMLKRERKAFAAFRDPTGMKNLLAERGTQLPQKDYDLVMAVATDMMVRTTSTLFLDLAPQSLDPGRRIAVVLFTALVVNIDDIIDDLQSPEFSSGEELLSYVLSQAFSVDGKKIQLRKIYDRTLALLPSVKQVETVKFLSEMADLHVCVGNKGNPGEYGYNDALNYKIRTGVAYVATGLSLAESRLVYTDMGLTRFVTAVQAYDDGLDCLLDARNRKQNLYVGMARDVWQQKGCPLGQDLDFLLQQLGRQTLSPRNFMRHRNMKDTRKAYLQAFKSPLDNSEPIPYRRVVRFFGWLWL